VQVHERVVDSLDGVDSLIVVNTNQEIVTHLPGTLQELDVAYIEQVRTQPVKKKTRAFGLIEIHR
jgi:hypothetical protein